MLSDQFEQYRRAAEPRRELECLAKSGIRERRAITCLSSGSNGRSDCENHIAEWECSIAMTGRTDAANPATRAGLSVVLPDVARSDITATCSHPIGSWLTRKGRAKRSKERRYEQAQRPRWHRSLPCMPPWRPLRSETSKICNSTASAGPAEPPVIDTPQSTVTDPEYAGTSRI